jgi:putative Mg2+ transporter-C (MgtC) family protein
MNVQIDWQEVALRLGLTALACGFLGINREEHRQPAGLRTTLLVGLAAAISMIQVNLLLNTTGKASDSFVVLDLMRLPLGILSGMGFIGAGAILRKENMVAGVTTAATLWFVTVMGLCFGGGQLGLGVCACILGFLILTGLKYVEHRCKRDHRALLTLTGNERSSGEGSSAEISRIVTEAGFKIAISSITLGEKNVLFESKYELHWYGHPLKKTPPAFLSQLANTAHFSRMEWKAIV